MQPYLLLKMVVRSPFRITSSNVKSIRDSLPGMCQCLDKSMFKYDVKSMSNLFVQNIYLNIYNISELVKSMGRTVRNTFQMAFIPVQAILLLLAFSWLRRLCCVIFALETWDGHPGKCHSEVAIFLQSTLAYEL